MTRTDLPVTAPLHLHRMDRHDVTIRFSDGREDARGVYYAWSPVDGYLVNTEGERTHFVAWREVASVTDHGRRVEA